MSFARNSRAVCTNIVLTYKINFSGQYPGGIGFTACIGITDLTELGANHVINFDKVITNTGAAFHSNTGVFLAPLKGKVKDLDKLKTHKNYSVLKNQNR